MEAEGEWRSAPRRCGDERIAFFERGAMIQPQRSSR
jgi:hypothetical protein